MRTILSSPQSVQGGQRRRGDEGQAIVEYVLMLAVMVTVVVMMGRQFQRSATQLWVLFSKEIAAACPRCTPPPNVR